MECSIYLDVLDVLGRGNVENDSLAHVVAEVEDQFGSDNAVQGVRSAPVGVTRSDAMEIQKVCRSQEIEGKRERERERGHLWSCQQKEGAHIAGRLFPECPSTRSRTKL
jgi:hypothetical protein